ncbi:PAS domain-containing protein [Halobacteria archaeon AArc-m2/3/4]|uniref:PAS domain-containing protein n=1 Tax=Natronoglomus mannanivorans TaxID=2979990 RepID=A0ABT2QEP4_9EURY|nr:PAS domain-containing protein [Halobacteria archaeon AArc-m2/3/4]
MSWQLTSHLFPQIAAVLVSLVLAVVIWRARTSRSSVALGITVIGIVGWSTVYALQIASTDLETKLLWNDFRFLFVLVTVVGYVVFAARYTSNDRWLRQPIPVAIVVPAAITLALVFTNDAHGLVRAGERLETVGGAEILVFEYGRWFWAHVAYIYVLMAVAIGWIVRFARRNWTIYRDQAAIIVLAAIVPWIGSVLYVFGVTTVEYTTFGLSISTVAFAWAMYRYDLLDLVPIARERVVEEMRDGVIVLDIEDRIVDCNEAALPILTADTQSDALGSDVHTQLEATPLPAREESCHVTDGCGVDEPVGGTDHPSGDVATGPEREPAHTTAAGTDRERVAPGEIDERDTMLDLETGLESVVDDEFETVVGTPLDALFARDRRESCATEVTCPVDGERRHYVLLLSPFHDDSGKLTGRLVVAEDVTAMRRRERKLEHARSVLERRTRQLEMRNREQATLIENLPGVVYRYSGLESDRERGRGSEREDRSDPESEVEHDSDHGDWRETESVTFVSSGADELTGYSAREFESGDVSLQSIVYPDDRETTTQQKQLAIDEGTRFDVTYRVVTNDETQRWVRDIGEGVYDEHGNLEFVEGFILDVTGNKRREQLQVLTRVLRHNIRNEMNVISGRIDLAIQDAQPAVREHLEVVERVAHRVTRLGTKARDIQQLLDSDGAPDIERLDVTRTVEQAVAKLVDEHPDDVSVETNVPSELEIYGNELLGTAVYELLENAVVHTGTAVYPTQITVTIRSTTTERAEIRIEDDGPGIPESELEALNGRMESPLVHGSGLGLWVVRWIVDAYGDLEISSDEGGTTASIRLRRVEDGAVTP